MPDGIWIRPYTAADVPEMAGIWNEVVRDGVAFPQTEVLGDENPVYLLYRMETGGEQELYLVRMVMTEEGWKYDYFSLATEEQISAMNRHLPSERNGKWYVVKG